jgi:DNA-binding NtrC family response regulator
MRKLLYVDDEVNNLITIQALLKKWFQVDIAENAKAALKMMETENYTVLISDQRMPEITGLELAKKVFEDFPDTIIVILTAFDDKQTMLDAINQGGIFRFLLKPADINDLRQTIESAFFMYDLKKQRIELINDLVEKNRILNDAYSEIEALKNQLLEENIQLKNEVSTNHDFSEIVGKSKILKNTLTLISKIAKSDSTVLITGETGTGKELFANAIHQLSERKNSIFIKINCAAIPETLIESELFGYEKGAFTGANSSKFGKFEMANGGTIFLDEIGELPLLLQSKLLRVIQEKEVERLGSNKPVKIDVRVIAATNRNLEDEVKKGHFRSDLYYRLNVIPVNVPPLRERKEDIPLLINYFIEKLNRKTQKTINSISPTDLKQLMEYNWPGNIRELENIIERSHILSSGAKLKVEFSFSATTNGYTDNDAIISLDENEKQYIAKILKLTNWKIRGKNGAAELLDINPNTLDSRIKKLGINNVD